MGATSRRQFTTQSLGSLLTYSLLETLCRHDLFAGEVKPITARWLKDVNQLGQDVKDQKIEQLVWQQKVEALFDQVEMADLLRGIDFDKLAAGAKLIDSGALSLKFNFPKVEGLPTTLVFGKQIFALKKGRSVVPHGHNNMATAFLILKGDLQGRHYDRLEDEKDHILIKPTIDRKFVPGEHSSVSDFKDNIHWFEAITEPAFILNIHVLGVQSGSVKPTGRVYLDPKGEPLEGGKIRARRLNYREAHELYG